MTTIDYSKRTIGALVKERADMYGKRTFMVYNQSEISYQELDEVSNQVANYLLEIGVKKGDHVMVMSPNCPEYIYSWFGINKIGGVLVGINPKLRGSILEHQIQLCGTEVLFMAGASIDTIANTSPSVLKNIKKIIVFGEEEEKKDDVFKLESIAPIACWPDILKYPVTAPGIEVYYYDNYGIVWTSGTTGYPKATMLCHNYVFTYSTNIVEHLNMTSDDGVLNFYPLHGVSAQEEHVMPALIAGAKLVLWQKWDVNKFWDAVRKYGITYLLMYERVLPNLLEQPAKENDRDNPLRVVLAVPAPAPVKEKEFFTRFGARVLGAGGMTEVGITPIRPFDAPEEKILKGNAMGPANCGVEMKIFDDLDNELPPNEIGEIVYRPCKPFTSYSGYYKNQQETLDMWRNLWIHSGDLGFKDEDGWFYFVSRKGDRLRSKGQMFTATEVEEVISKHHNVEEAAIVGLPGEYGDETVMLFMVPKNLSEVNYEEIIEFCNHNLAYYMIPRYIEILEALPKTENKKTKKGELKKRGVSNKTWDRKRA